MVIMKVSQADTINMLYKSFNDTIVNLKNSITEKKHLYDSINKEILRKKDTIFYWEGKYQASRELYFPKQNITFKTKSRGAYFFPGDMNYIHGVNVVKEGTRYTCPFFWTITKLGRE